jgi:MFS family permease
MTMTDTVVGPDDAAADVHERDGKTRAPRRTRLTFVAAVFALVVSFVTVGATVPLFNIYRAEDGLTNADISLTVVAYSAATLMTLLVFGRVSSFVGRRSVSAFGLLLLLIGCVMFTDVHSAAGLIASRVVLGAGAALASSAISSFVIDSAPSRPVWLAGVASSQSVMIGLAVGGLGAGVLVQFGPWPRTLIFTIVCALVGVAIGMIALSRETVARSPGLWRSLRPDLRIPAPVKRMLPVAIAVLLPTWATGAFYQAFVPAIVEEQVHTVSPLMVGIIFALYMGPSAVGAVASGRLAPGTGQRVGMLLFLIGMSGVVVAIWTGAVWIFVTATALAGAAQGVAISATTRALLHDRMASERAPTFTVIYLISYLSATAPSLLAGQLSQFFSLLQITYGYAGLALIAAVFTVIAAQNAGSGVRSPQAMREPR